MNGVWMNFFFLMRFRNIMHIVFSDLISESFYLCSSYFIGINNRLSCVPSRRMLRDGTECWSKRCLYLPSSRLGARGRWVCTTKSVGSTFGDVEIGDFDWCGVRDRGENKLSQSLSY